MTPLKLPSPIAGRQMNLLFDAERSEGLSSCGARQSRPDTGSDPDAGGRPQCRGA